MWFTSFQGTNSINLEPYYLSFMGNAISPCFSPIGSKPAADGINLVLWDGTIKTVMPSPSKRLRSGDGGGRVLAGEVMLEHGCDFGMAVCPADSFFLGRPIPSLDMDDPLVPGQTYYILPIDFFPCTNDDRVITSSSIASLCSSSSSAALLVSMSSGSDGGNGPFECIRDSNGKFLIKVLPDFITRLILQRNNKNNNENSVGYEGFKGSLTLCDTPELKKQYDLLVGSKEQMWSPKLDTIKEFGSRSYTSRKSSSSCSFFRSKSLSLPID